MPLEVVNPLIPQERMTTNRQRCREAVYARPFLPRSTDGVRAALAFLIGADDEVAFTHLVTRHA